MDFARGRSLDLFIPLSNGHIEEIFFTINLALLIGLLRMDV